MDDELMMTPISEISIGSPETPLVDQARSAAKFCRDQAARLVVTGGEDGTDAVHSIFEEDYRILTEHAALFDALADRASQLIPA